MFTFGLLNFGTFGLWGFWALGPLSVWIFDFETSGLLWIGTLGFLLWVSGTLGFESSELLQFYTLGLWDFAILGLWDSATFWDFGFGALWTSELRVL